MTRTRYSAWQLRILVVLGAFGYIAAAFQWLFAFILAFPLLKESAIFTTPEPVETPIVVPVGEASEPNILALLFAGLIVMAIIALTIYVVIRIPVSLAKVGRSVTTESSEALAPVVEKITHKKVSKKQRIQLRARLAIGLKLLIVLIPLISSLILSRLVASDLSPDLGIGVALWLGGVSIGWFIVQYGVARLLRVPIQEIW